MSFRGSPRGARPLGVAFIPLVIGLFTAAVVNGCGDQHRHDNSPRASAAPAPEGGAVVSRAPTLR